MALHGDESGGVAGLRLVHNELHATAAGTLQARATDRFEELPRGAVFRSVGYRGVPIPGVPFHDAWGVILNDKGRVLEPDSREPRIGEYAAGWIKRGPSGVIGTNKPDAAETVACMVEDAGAGSAPRALRAGRRRRSGAGPAAPAPVHLVGRLAAARRARGRARPRDRRRPRVKFTRVEEMLAALGR